MAKLLFAGFNENSPVHIFSLTYSLSNPKNVQSDDFRDKTCRSELAFRHNREPMCELIIATAF